MNLNKFTKAELISKIKKQTQIKDTNSKFVEFFLALKSVIIKLTIISLLIKIFKKYTFVTKVLRFSNWIILTIFGISVFDAFGLHFLSNLFKEVRNIFAGIVGYLSNTTFYNYVFSIFKSTEDIKATEKPKISLRETYQRKMPPDYSWEKEYERRNALARWINKEEVKTKDSDNKYLILLGLLLLSAASWYYGNEIKTFVTDYSSWLILYRNIRDNIRNIWNNPQVIRPDNEAFNIKITEIKTNLINFISEKSKMDPELRFDVAKILNNKIENIKTEFPAEFEAWFYDPVNKVLINTFLSSYNAINEVNNNNNYDNIEKEVEIVQDHWSDPGIKSPSLTSSLETIKPSTSQIPLESNIPPIPSTSQGAPNSLLADIIKGKSLKKTETIVRDGTKGKGKVVDNNTNNELKSNDLDDELMSKISQLKPTETKVTDSIEYAKQEYKNIKNKTEDNSLLTALSKKFNDFNKFDDNEEETLSPPWDDDDDKISKLDKGKEKADDKVSLYELKDPDEIKQSTVTPTEATKYIEMARLPKFSQEMNEEIFNIMSENQYLNSIEIVNKIKEKFTDYSEKDYTDAYLQVVNRLISDEGANKKAALKYLVDKDTASINEMKIGITDSYSIRNVINENYTHSSLLREIKSKSSRQ